MLWETIGKHKGPLETIGNNGISGATTGSPEIAGNILDCVARCVLISAASYDICVCVFVARAGSVLRLTALFAYSELR